MPDTKATVYRQLQRHLDQHPVGFPATKSGEDLKLLEQLFTPVEARLALHLSHKPQPTATIAANAAATFPEAEVEPLLHTMFMKGAIARKEKEGVTYWHTLPLVIGMYELQDGNPSRRFLITAGAYMNTLEYKRSLLAAAPSQMRTIPVNKSIQAAHQVAPYDQIRAIIAEAPGPFVILNCICRTSAQMRRKPCRMTTRSETCLAMGDTAAMVLRRQHGREISREEALEILTHNEKDGLVLQPSGVKKPEFVCSCCGCCCGMLGMQKQLPHPLDFWTTSYHAEARFSNCTGCGACIKRCQVGALVLAGSQPKVSIDLNRCIGCGLCVSVCAQEALRLVKNDQQPEIPEDEEHLHETIRENKKGTLAQWLMLAKLGLGWKQ